MTCGPVVEERTLGSGMIHSISQIHFTRKSFICNERNCIVLYMRMLKTRLNRALAPLKTGKNLEN
jgi:hypothetical protein